MENKIAQEVYQIKAIKVREDIETIVQQSEEDFNKWYNDRKQAGEMLLKTYQLFGSIPHLGYEQGQHTMMDDMQVHSHVDVLTQGLGYLEEIKKLHSGYRKSNSNKEE